MYKWSEFLKGFGPLTNVVNNVHHHLHRRQRQHDTDTR
jgi:hypothetical protein